MRLDMTKKNITPRVGKAHKTDILFVYPPISVSERYGKKVSEVGGNLPPLGVAYLAAYAREKGYTVGLIDAVVDDYTVASLVHKVLEIKPRVVGISALTPNYFRALRFAKELRKKNKDIMIILGGPHATIMPIECMKTRCFDMLVYGEGELTIVEVLSCFKKNNWDKDKFLEDYEALGSINGVVYRDSDRNIKITAQRERIADLDELPMPAWDLLPMHKYLPMANQYKRKPVANLIVIRGCPFNCSFCSSSQFFGRKVRSMSPGRVMELIVHLKKKYGAKEISFWDDMLTINKPWLHKLCDLMIKARLNMTWTCLARVDSVDYELLAHMKKAGCWNIFFGFESGSQELLDNIGKGITIEQIEKANALCKKIGIEVRASFMLALPGETPELGRKTIEFAKKLNSDYTQFSITTPYPGTRLYAEAKKYGSLKKSFSEYHGWKAVFVPFGYKNAKQIEDLEKQAMREYYMRPRYIIGRIAKISSWQDIARYIKGIRFLIGFTKK
jgi:radical SAM superfamily enzyme YgiQ (UPF0313 family)